MDNVEILGLGTAAIGRPQYINVRDKKSESVSLDTFRQNGLKILDKAYDQGIRYFDTAPGYGMSEDLLLDWLSAKNDETIEVATKWGYTYVADFNPNATVHEIKEHSLEKLNEQWEKSKKMLPWLSTYQIHSATFDTGVLDNERILDRLSELKQLHNLNIGLSTTGSNQNEVIKKALEVEINGVPLFDAFQVTYNIFDQSLSGISDNLQHKRIIIKEALANGRVFPNSNYTNYTSTYKLLKTLSLKYGVGIDAVALRFCVDTIPTFKVLSGASNTSHLTDNIKTAKFRLEKEDIELLKKHKVSSDSYWTERKLLNWN